MLVFVTVASIDSFLFSPSFRSWSWTAFVWFHSNFSVVIHNVSVWLTLSLAVWRFIMIKFHAKAPVYCTMARCKMVILCAYGEPELIELVRPF